MADRYDQAMMLGYLEGDLSPPQRAMFERQLREDPQLAALVEQMQQDRQLLRGLDAETAPDDLMDAVNERIARRMLLDAPPSGTAGRVGPRRLQTRRVMAWAAVAAMLVLSAGVVWLTIGNNDLLWPHEGKQYAFENESKTSAPQPLEMDDDQALGEQQVARADSRARTAAAKSSVSTSKHPGGELIDEAAPAPAREDTLAEAEPAPAAAALEAIEPAKPVHVQIDVTTDDTKACTADLLAYAAEAKLEVSPPVSDGPIDLVCSGTQLPPLLAKLNAPQGQSAQLVERQRSKRDITMRSAQAVVPQPAQTKLEDADRLGQMRRQWRSLLEQQVPLLPVTPVYDFDTTYKVQVAVRQSVTLEAPADTTAPDAPDPSSPTP